MKRPGGARPPAGRLPPQIEHDRINRLGIRQTVQGLQRNDAGHHTAGTLAGPRKRKHTARLEKMPRYRFRIQQFALTLRSPLHPKIIAKYHSQQGDRHGG